jgi:hypothetical protein
MVVQDPRIRLKIGNRFFKVRAYPLTDPDGIEMAREAFLRKYPEIRGQEAMPEAPCPEDHRRDDPSWLVPQTRRFPLAPHMMLHSADLNRGRRLCHSVSRS